VSKLKCREIQDAAVKPLSKMFQYMKRIWSTTEFRSVWKKKPELLRGDQVVKFRDFNPV